MIPLITTLALSIVSFFASTFVIIRIVLPILPPHPLSRRVRPSEFGLPDFRSLSAADKSHVWLAACDIIALFLFIAEVLMQYYGSPAGYSTVSDVGSSVRLWLALSLRPTCLLVISSLTLLHVRLGKPVTFGARHWMLWMPTVVLVAVSTATAGVIAGVGPKTFFFGTIGYTSILALGSTVTFAGLVGTLFIIKRNLQAIEDPDSWPPAREEEHKPRPSFATADVDALRDGSSWITSRADSDHESISAFSFSTHNTHIQNPAAASNPSIHPKSSYWFNPSTPYLNGNAPESVPPVPPIPSPYRGRVCGDDHPDPFRRSETPVERAALTRNSSQGSWLSTTTESRPTLSAWSFSTSCPNSPALDAAVASTNDVNSHLIQSRPNTPAMSNAQVLGGYGYVPPSGTDSEKGFPKLVAPDASGEVDVSVFRIVAWLAGIWIPFGLSIPYLATLNPAHPYANMTTSILLILSITLSSPLLAVNILMRHGIPIPTGLFDAQKEPPSIVHRAPSPADSFPLPPVFSTEYKRSTSTTVVEGRRSTDVWLAKGEAVDGRSRVGRALGMLAPAPKLSVLPPEDVDDAGYANVPLTPPLPIQDPTESLPSTPQSEHPGEIGRYLTLPPRSCEKSSTSSAYLSADESGLTAHVMVAQRHYSHKALTLILPPSPKEQAELSSVGGDSEPVTPIDPIMVRATGTSAKASTPPTHLRTRSVSSLASPRFPVSPGIGSPMQSPLTHRPRSHKKAHSAMSAASFDFGTVPRDDTAEIDKLSAGLLPLLVPGLKVGADVRILTSDAIPAPAGSLSKHTSGASWHARASGAALEFGGFPVDDLSSPQIRTTPHRRARKTSTHKRHHLSLPSFAFGKDGIQSLAGWVEDTDTALSEKIDEYAGGDRRKSIALMQTTSRPASSIAPQSDSFLRTPSRPSRSAAPTPPPSERLPEVPVRRTPRKSKRAIPEDRNSLALLIAALEQPASPLPSASSEQTLFDREGIAPLAESTPPDYRHRSNSRPSISYVRSDANPSSHGDAKPRRILHRFRPVALGGDKRLPAIESSPDNAQAASENVAPPTAPVARGLRPLSLLQDRPAAPAVRGLSVNKKSSKSKRSTLGGENGDKEDVAVVDHIAAGKAKATAGDKENRENPGVSDSSVGKKHKRLRSLKLGRSDTTKERAALRTRENIPNVIVRPPSDVFSAFVGFR